MEELRCERARPPRRRRFSNDPGSDGGVAPRARPGCCRNKVAFGKGFFGSPYEQSFGAVVRDVSKPTLARLAGLGDAPGFDLLSDRAPSSTRCIEVKGRAVSGDVFLTDNEWAKAANLRDRYWLYVVLGCASPG